MNRLNRTCFHKNERRICEILSYPLVAALAAGMVLGCDTAADDPHVVTGELEPLYYEFLPISETPDGFSTWQVVFGTQLTGGLSGTTDDLEYSILDPDGSGEINGVGTFTGSLNGFEGGFIFESVGQQFADGTFQTAFSVKEHTVWGDLVGLRGSGKVTATRDHCGPDDTPETCLTLVSYSFEYWQD